MEERFRFGVAPALHGARVLLVEDDILLLMELEAILREALAVTDRDGVAAAILDVRVGRETIAPVARQLASRGTPFIFYTGQVESDPDLAEWTGHRVLSKPARASAIVAAVAEALHAAPAARN